MANITVQPPLSNVQTELLKLFSAGIPDSQLLELKKVMAKFLLDQARDKADIMEEFALFDLLILDTTPTS